MFIHLRLMILSFCALLALPALSTAQEQGPAPKFMMPLRADEVIADTAKDRAIIRGSIDWPDGRTTTSVVIMCDGKSGSVLVMDRLGITQLLVAPDFCNVLARSVQRRN